MEIPEQLWDEHVQNNGPLSREEFFAQYLADLMEEGAADDAVEPSRSEPQSAPEADVVEPAEPSSGGVSAAGEVSSELADADASPGAVRRLPGPAGAGSGLEDGPMMWPTLDCPIPGGKGHTEAGTPWLDPPRDPGPSDHVRPGPAEGPNGPTPAM